MDLVVYCFSLASLGLRPYWLASYGIDRDEFVRIPKSIRGLFLTARVRIPVVRRLLETTYTVGVFADHVAMPIGTMPPRPALPPAVTAIMTVDEAAKFLRLNRKTLYNAIRRGELPGVRRLGRRLLVSRETVLQWLREGQGSVSCSGRKKP